MRPLLIALVSLATPFSFTLAQVGISDRLTIDVKPAFPHADTPLSMSVRAISLDLDSAHIVWKINGMVVGEGEGVTAMTGLTKGLGTKTIIEVEALGLLGERLSSTRLIQPAEVDLLWESSSYVPPLYRGKRLASPGGEVRVMAVSHLVRSDGSRVPDKDIVFTWRRNDAVITSASGRGKAVATFSGPEMFGTDTISLEAASVGDSIIGAATILIPSTDPFVLLYYDHPLYGVLYHHAVMNNSSFPDIEATFVAAPYFAGALSAQDPRLNYAWRVNNTPIQADAASPSRITINAEKSDGAARINLDITHSTDFLMNARGEWRLNLQNGFDAESANLFGGPSN